MKTERSKHPRGVTLTEIIIAVALLSVLMAAAVPFLINSVRGMSALQATDAVNTNAQAALNRIKADLIECRQIIDRDVDNNNFDSLVQEKIWGGLGHAVLQNTRLPLIEPAGTLSTESASFANQRTSVGNSLLIVRYDRPEDIAAPNASYRIDTYRFIYYYLTPTSTSENFNGVTRRTLWRWESVRFADFDTLNAIGNEDDAQFIRTSMIAPGPRRIQFAYQPANSLLRRIRAGGFSSLSDEFVIPAEPGRHLEAFTAIRGIAAGGFRLGVAPNSSDLKLKEKVPLFADYSLASPSLGQPQDFPSGFEVVIVGQNMARQVFVRLVLAAKGGFKGTVSQETNIFTTARDSW